jgi:ferredoxin-NADP reductase
VNLSMVEALVTQRRTVAAGVIELELQHPDGLPLPAWTPGAHIDLVLDADMVRQYSLCGNPEEPAYRIAVLCEARGRGGSRRIHDQLRVGDSVRLRGPRNHFVLENAPSYLFVAGGIGITPLLPMIAQAERVGTHWSLNYGGRARSTMAYLDELEWLDAGRDRVRIVPFDECGLIDLRGALASAPVGAHVYCCGPEPLLVAMQECCKQPLRTERFSPRIPGETVNTAFTVRLAATEVEIVVPADRSLLDVLSESGVDVLTSCEEGTCGTCATAVLGGIPDHRDSVLTEDERAAADRMLVCVSRSRSRLLVLDI